MVQFAQRIGVEYHLNPLNSDEVIDYVHHRLKVAGGDPALFTEEAIAIVDKYSGGIPRLINTLCDMSLVYGFARQEDAITADVVMEVVEDKLRGGIFPAATPVRQGAALNESTGF